MINLKSLNEKQLLSYTIGGAVLVCIIPLLFLFYFQHITGNGYVRELIDNPENKIDQLAKLDADLKKAIAEVSLLEGLEKEKKDLENKLEKYEKALPAQKNIELLYKQIGVVFQNSKLKEIFLKDYSKQITPAVRKKSKEPYFSYDVEIGFQGRYQDIIAFIHQVETKNERFVMMSSLNLKSIINIENEDDYEYMEGAIKFTTFFKPEDKK